MHALTRGITPGVAAAFVLLASTHAAAAPDDLCIPQSRAVPGAANPFPEWWESTANNKEQRWTGATQKVGNPATSAVPELASLRAVWDAASRRIFVHVSVRSDPEINPSQDMLAFAITDDAGAPVLYFDVRPMLGCAAAATTNFGDIAAACTGEGAAISGGGVGSGPLRFAAGTPGGGWDSITATNPTTGGSFEVSPLEPWVQVRQAGSQFDWDFKVALEVPVDGSGMVDPDVRIYATTFVAFDHPSPATPVVVVQYPLLCNPGTGGTCEMTHPSAGPTLPTAVPSSAGLWPAIQTGTTGDCEGIELMRDLVGSDDGTTMGVVPGTSVSYELPGRTLEALSGSSLRAGFHNDTTAALSTGSVTADFRIANWGINYADWDQATWDLVADDVPLAGSVDPGAYAGAPSQGAIQSPPYTAGSVPSNPHQCMHVKLDAVPGTGSAANFKVDSVYRNMDFVSASVMQRPADLDLSTRGLAAGQSNNPVYLIVRTHNMPSVAMCEELKGDLEGCYVPNTDEDPEAVWDELPTYTVHGFVDSGARVNLPDDPQVPVLTPMGAYGYRVQHEGPIGGWEHRLEGAAPLQPYEDVYYLEVGEGMVASVVDTIRVIDPQTQPCATALPPTPAVPAGPGGVVEGGNPTPVAPQADPAHLGCEPASVRPQCEPDACAPHDPCAFIEGSEYTHAPQDGAAGPGEIEPGPSCCLQTGPGSSTKGAGQASCMFIVLLGLRRRRRRRKP